MKQSQFVLDAQESERPKCERCGALCGLPGSILTSPVTSGEHSSVPSAITRWRGSSNTNKFQRIEAAHSGEENGGLMFAAVGPGGMGTEGRWHKNLMRVFQ